MDEFSYAHRNTSGADRWNKPNIPAALQAIRESAFAREIPVAGDETLCFLMAQAAACRPDCILELGTCPGAKITTVEREEKFYDEAVENFARLGISARVFPVLGDAGEVVSRLEGQFGLIFMDSAKVQYVKYLPRLKRLLVPGGVLIADDVLLYGWATGEAEVPKKRRMLARHIEEYLEAVTSDAELTTSVIRVGDGMAVSVKRRDDERR